MDPFPSWLTTTYATYRKFQDKISGRAPGDVGEEHYDHPVPLFEQMLGPKMQYSCLVYDNEGSMEAAEKNKIDMLLEYGEVEQGTRHLDIGCGWGGFARATARHGAKVTGITISKEQYRYAQDLPHDDLEVRLQDYRNLPGDEEYDLITIIGMMEHVHHSKHRHLMETVYENLTDDGILVLDTIGSPTTVTRTDPWIEQYIFPESMNPSQRQIAEATEGLLEHQRLTNIGKHYDTTCMDWHSNFEDGWDSIREVTDLDERFRRMWNLYLQSSAAMFRSEQLHNWVFKFTKRAHTSASFFDLLPIPNPLAT